MVQSLENKVILWFTNYAEQNPVRAMRLNVLSFWCTFFLHPLVIVGYPPIWTSSTNFLIFNIAVMCSFVFFNWMFLTNALIGDNSNNIRIIWGGKYACLRATLWPLTFGFWGTMQLAGTLLACFTDAICAPCPMTAFVGIIIASLMAIVLLLLWAIGFLLFFCSRSCYRAFRPVSEYSNLEEGNCDQIEMK